MSDPALVGRFVRFADALDEAGRAPLTATLMRGAGEDLAAGGIVAQLVDGIDLPSGAVPALRLVGALHHLVLTGHAAALARYYPTAGGTLAPAGVWPVARDALRDNAGRVRERLSLGVQTNEPGRSAVLYPALLWLTERYGLPIRLLEFGASAGLNLAVDRYAYVSDGLTLGTPGSPVRFEDPWAPAPAIDLAGAAARLRIAERAGCDPAPLDPADPGDQLGLLAFVWADEPVRFARMRAALELVAADPPPVTAAPAQEWLARRLATRPAGTLTVVWESVVRQYVPAGAWAQIEAALDEAQASAGTSGPVVWLQMEAGTLGAPMELALRTEAGGDWLPLAACHDHGPPVEWLAASD